MKPVFQVSEFVEAINRHLDLLGEVVVEGEVSRIDVKKGRLIFGTIKDTDSAVDIFSLTHIVRNVTQLEDGMLVRVTGTPGLYKGSGRFRLFSSDITPQGEGALRRALEKLMGQLEAEGLFADTHKRPLPDYPEHIGVITAKGSSAYHDVVKIIHERYPLARIKHLPVTVQGKSAVPTLLKAFKYINAHPDEFDVTILTRGGGSLEDLMAFNDEQIARAIFASKVPVISAVGHEDDVTLADHVADTRASTPSNAAEMVVPERRQLVRNIDQAIKSSRFELLNRIHRHQKEVIRSLVHARRTLQSIIDQINRHITMLSPIKLRLNRQIARTRDTIDRSLKTTHRQTGQLLHEHQIELVHLKRLLKSLDYKEVLKRGYSITRSGGRIITSIKDVNLKDNLETTLHQGKIISSITKTER